MRLGRISNKRRDSKSAAILSKRCQCSPTGVGRRSAAFRRELEAGEPKREQRVDDYCRPAQRIYVAVQLTIQGNEEANHVANQACEHDRSAPHGIDDIARKPGDEANVDQGGAKKARHHDDIAISGNAVLRQHLGRSCEETDAEQNGDDTTMDRKVLNFIPISPEVYEC